MKLVLLFFLFMTSIFFFHRDKVLEKEREERWKQLEALCQGKLPPDNSSVETSSRKESSQETSKEENKNSGSESPGQDGETKPKTDSSITIKSET